ncbi:MAG: hypothetical protein SGPRY_014795 [Prymnesium sp.]
MYELKRASPNRRRAFLDLICEHRGEFLISEEQRDSELLMAVDTEGHMLSTVPITTNDSVDDPAQRGADFDALRGTEECDMRGLLLELEHAR